MLLNACINDDKPLILKRADGYLTFSPSSLRMEIQELAKNLYETGIHYKKHSGGFYFQVFDKLTMSILEWANKNNVREIDASKPAFLLALRAIAKYSRMKNYERAFTLLNLALNKAPIEDYMKECPITPKPPRERQRHEHVPNDTGNWDGSWDNVVRAYEDGLDN